MMHGNYPKKTCAFLNDLGCTNEVIEDYYRSLVGLRTRIHSTPPYAPNPEEYYMKCSDGTNIFVQEFIPEEMNSLVLMQHGNQCQGDLYYPVADHLYPNGIGVICVDNRGHGRSGPKRGILSEPQLMCGIYDQLLTKYQKFPTHFFGASLGAAMASMYLAQSSRAGQKLSSLILLVPPFKPRLNKWMVRLKYLIKFGLAVGTHLTGQWKLIKYKSDLNGTYLKEYKEMDKMDVVRAPKSTIEHFKNLMGLMYSIKEDILSLKHFNLPAFFMAGTDDQLLDPEGILEMANFLDYEGIRTHIFEGAHHGLLNDKNAQTIYDMILEWIMEHS